MRTIEVSNAVYRKLEGLKRYYDDFKYDTTPAKREWVSEHPEMRGKRTRTESSWSEFLNMLWGFTNTAIIRSQK